MRITTWVAWGAWLFLAGCSTQGGGPQGSAGLQGPAGAPGANGGLVWKDARGMDLGPYVLMSEAGATNPSPFPAYFDGAGNIWSVDPVTASLGGPVYAAAIVYEGANCTGTGYMQADVSLPRLVMVLSYGDDKEYYVIADDAVQERTAPTLASFRYFRGGTATCNNYRPAALSYVYYRDAQVRQVYLPNTNATAPLHVERLLP